jgi:divalent metal cation (Fe/Co/Zn/Cd) transporter
MVRQTLQLEYPRRATLLKRARHLEYFTIAYNGLEGLVAIAAGLFSGSIALVGFGFDSIIEVTSAAAILWRLHADRYEPRRARAERITLRIVGICFLTLAAYIGYDSISSLLRIDAPAESLPGIILAAISVVVMPLLARAKRTIAERIGSAAMRSDARQTDLCTYLSAILLAGLFLNAQLGWWWADPVAALVMVPIMVKEGVAGLHGEGCCESGIVGTNNQS